MPTCCTIASYGCLNYLRSCPVTHGAEIARPADFSLESAVQQHFLELVAESVQELPHGGLRLLWRRQKVVEVKDAGERRPWRLVVAAADFAVGAKYLPRSRGHLPVLPQKTQPSPSTENVQFLHTPRQQKILVTNGHSRKDQPFCVNHMRFGVDGRGEQVSHPVRRPGEEKSQRREKGE